MEFAGGICLFTIMILLGQFLRGLAENNCTIADYGLKASTPSISCALTLERTQQGMGTLVNTHLYFVHCDMVLDCNEHKGWMRITNFRGDNCPDGWVKNTTYKFHYMGGDSGAIRSLLFHQLFNNWQTLRKGLWSD